VPVLVLKLGRLTGTALVLKLGRLTGTALVLKLGRLTGMASEWVLVSARALVENQCPVLVPEWVWD
jgi:hypothetical protein